jgi:hypothetical protein
MWRPGWPAGTVGSATDPGRYFSINSSKNTAWRSPLIWRSGAGNCRAEVQREFEDYLKCGRPDHGFLRVRMRVVLRRAPGCLQL